MTGKHTHIYLGVAWNVELGGDCGASAGVSFENVISARCRRGDAVPAFPRSAPELRAVGDLHVEIAVDVGELALALAGSVAASLYVCVCVGREFYFFLFAQREYA